MAVSNPSGPQFSEILWASLSSIGRNALFVAGLAVAGWAGVFGLQALVRVAEDRHLSAPDIASLTLVAAVVAFALSAATDSILYQRISD